MLLKSPLLNDMWVPYYITESKVIRHTELEVSGSCWELIGLRRGKGIKSFLQVFRTGLRSFPVSLGLFMGKPPGGMFTLGLRN